MPALARPKGLPLRSTSSGRCSLPPSQASPKFVRRHRDRRKGRGGLGLEEAETLGEFGRYQAAQGDVVDQHDQADRGPAASGAATHRHVVDDDGDLGLHVDPIGLVGHHDRIARRKETVGAALIHQRLGPEAGGHLGVAGLAHQFDMVDIGRPIRPLIGARQGRGGFVFVEPLRRLRAGFQTVRDLAKARADMGPVVQRRLQRAGDMADLGAAGQIPGNDDEAAVAGGVLECRKLHVLLLAPQHLWPIFT